MVTRVRPVIVVEDDPFLRLLQVILDPETPAARMSAFCEFFAHELPDFTGWCERLRARIGSLYPAEVRLVADESSLPALLPGAEVVAVEGVAIGRREIEAARGALTIVQKYGAVTSRIDLAACERAGVGVLTLRRRANIATAEHAFALMLALARKINETAGLLTMDQLRAAGYSPTSYDRAHTPNANWARVTGVRNLFGRQLGIVGMGEIGREMAARATAFGMRIVYMQRHRLSQQEEQRYHVTYCPLEDLLADSDYISLHLPGGPATRGLIGKRELAIIKPGALLINVSQPHIVDLAALLEALSSGHLGGFALDLPYEEPGQAGDPLIKFRNVIVTPHLGGSPRSNALGDFEELLLRLAQALQEL
jgi:phosphoglycerate dehydrogenase-like enzyme